MTTHDTRTQPLSNLKSQCLKGTCSTVGDHRALVDATEVNQKPSCGHYAMFRQSTHTNLTSTKRFFVKQFTLLQSTSHYKARENKRTWRLHVSRRTVALITSRPAARWWKGQSKTRLLAAGWEAPGYVTTLFTVYCADREIWSWLTTVWLELDCKWPVCGIPAFARRLRKT